MIATAAALLAIHTPSAFAEPTEAHARFELLHLWLTDAERHALAALSDPVKAAGVHWEEHPYQSSFLGLKTEYAERIALRLPPTGTHWIAGDELKAMIDGGVFRLIYDRPGRPSFKSILLPEVYDVVRHRDGITALPVGIHLQNHMAYNSAIFDKLGLSPPKTWDELLNSARALKEAGYIGLTMSDQRWQLRFLFSSILTGLLPPDEFVGLLRSVEVTDEQRSKIVQAFKILDALRPYVNKDNRDLAWVKATNYLIRGEAAMAILADFASTLYAGDHHIRCRLPPQNTYLVWAFDAIALTRTDNPAEIAGQNEFIDAASSVENLGSYVGRKGGIPVYRWSKLEGINSCSRQSVAEWTNATHKIHVGSDWSLSLNIIASIVQKFWRSGSITPEDAAEDLVVGLRNIRTTDPR